MIQSLKNRYRKLPLAARAAFWFMVCSFLQKAMSIITTPIFTRLMSTEQYGQFTAYSSWLNILTVITTLRLNYSVFNKGMSKYKDGRDAYVSTMQTITTILCFVLLIVYLLFRTRINNITELPTLVMLAMIAELMVTPAISFWTIRKRYEYIYRAVVICTVLMAVLNALVGVFAVYYSEEKGYYRIYSVVLVNLCFGIPLYIYNLRKGNYQFNREYAKFALLFNLPLMGHFLSMYVLEQSDKIMIQKMTSFEEVGLYGLTYHVGTLIKIFTTSLNNAIIPWMYGKMEKRDFLPVAKIIFFVVAMVALISLWLTTIAPEAIAIFAPSKYSEAVYVVPPIALGMLFQFLYMLYANIEFYFDFNKMTMIISGFAAVINLVLNYVGIKMFGYIAAAYSTLLCYILMCIGHYLYMMWGIKQRTGLSPNFSGAHMLVLLCGTLVAGILITFLYPYPYIRFTLIALAGIFALINRKKIVSMMSMIRKNE